MWRLAALIGLMAAPATAEVAEISNCRAKDQMIGTSVYCELTNLSQTAIAEMHFSIVIGEEGRTVPWISDGDEQRPVRISIAGGVEPQETRELHLWSDLVSPQATRELLRIEIAPVRFLDVNGAEISSP